MPCRSSGIYFIMLPVRWKFLSLEKKTILPQVIKQHYYTPFCSIMQIIIQMELLNGEKPSSLNIKILLRLPGVKRRIMGKRRKSRKLLFMESCAWLSMPLIREGTWFKISSWLKHFSFYLLRGKCFSVFTVQTVIC